MKSENLIKSKSTNLLINQLLGTCTKILRTGAH